ncbi:MAG TPA: hypothetical protein VKB80_14695 [Kofleriaceae bacterium]|nr:hypothetical protein [Kofleriaceae bacterium]
MRGFTLGVYPGDGGAALRRVDEVAATGATWVALVVSWEQADVRSAAIARSPRVTAPDAALRGALRRARERGLRALVFPILTVRAVRTGEWRGALRPADVSAWWRSYEAFILHYAALAASESAAALVVGSELGFSEGWRDRWYHLLSRVERVYRGELVYSANWDHYREVSFLARLDHLGVSAYFELARGGEASEAELVAAWRRAAARLRAFAREKRVSLWLTEVGYPSRDGAAAHPWDYTATGPIDLEEQRRCFAALIAAWDGAAELDGLFVWNWWGEGGPRDGDYTPRGKPAEKLLRRWFGAR